MTQDDSLRAKARQNTLRAFLSYEAKLKLAYARSQNPQSRRRHSANKPRGAEGLCE